MTYRVVVDDDVGAEVAALPDEVLDEFALVLDLLVASPYQSDLYHAARPDGGLRVVSFGPGGRAFVVFLVLESERRVEVVRVISLD